MGDVFETTVSSDPIFYANTSVVTRPADAIIYSADSQPVIIRLTTDIPPSNLPVFDARAIIPQLKPNATSGTYIYADTPSITDKKYRVQSFHIEWYPVDGATGYQVFFVENGKTAFDWNDYNKASPFNTYTNSVMFTNQSDPIDAGTTSFSFTYPTLSTVYKINALVFAYVGFNRSVLPSQMITFVGGNQKNTSIVNSSFLEYTDYFLLPGWFLYNDNSISSGGSSGNIEQLTNLGQHPYYYVDSGSFDFTSPPFVFDTLTVEEGTHDVIFVVTGGLNRDVGGVKVISLETPPGTNVTAINIDDVSYTVYQYNNTFWAIFTNELFQSESTLYSFALDNNITSVSNITLSVHPPYYIIDAGSFNFASPPFVSDTITLDADTQDVSLVVTGGINRSLGGVKVISVKIPPDSPSGLAVTDIIINDVPYTVYQNDKQFSTTFTNQIFQSELTVYKFVFNGTVPYLVNITLSA